MEQMMLFNTAILFLWSKWESKYNKLDSRIHFPLLIYYLKCIFFLHHCSVSLLVKSCKSLFFFVFCHSILFFSWSNLCNSTSEMHQMNFFNAVILKFWFKWQSKYNKLDSRIQYSLLFHCLKLFFFLHHFSNSLMIKKFKSWFSLFNVIPFSFFMSNFV